MPKLPQREPPPTLAEDLAFATLHLEGGKPRPPVGVVLRRVLERAPTWLRCVWAFEATVYLVLVVATVSEVFHGCHVAVGGGLPRCRPCMLGELALVAGALAYCAGLSWACHALLRSAGVDAPCYGAPGAARGGSGLTGIEADQCPGHATQAPADSFVSDAGSVESAGLVSSSDADGSDNLAGGRPRLLVDEMAYDRFVSERRGGAARFIVPARFLPLSTRVRFLVRERVLVPGAAAVSDWAYVFYWAAWVFALGGIGLVLASNQCARSATRGQWAGERSGEMAAALFVACLTWCFAGVLARGRLCSSARSATGEADVAAEVA